MVRPYLTSFQVIPNVDSTAAVASLVAVSEMETPILFALQGVHSTAKWGAGYKKALREQANHMMPQLATSRSFP